MARSLLKNDGPKTSGSTIGPFWPGTVGMEKHFPLMNWFGPSPLFGLQVRIGINGIWSVPLIDWFVIPELNAFFVASVRTSAVGHGCVESVATVQAVCVILPPALKFW